MLRYILCLLCLAFVVSKVCLSRVCRILGLLWYLFLYFQVFNLKTSYLHGGGHDDLPLRGDGDARGEVRELRHPGASPDPTAGCSAASSAGCCSQGARRRQGCIWRKWHNKNKRFSDKSSPTYSKYLFCAKIKLRNLSIPPSCTVL